MKTEEGVYVKDLRVINRPLSDMVLIDNASYSFAFQVDNGIPILNYYQDKSDTELLSLKAYLYQIKDVSDVRVFNQKMLQMREYYRFEDPCELITTLYN